MDFDVPKITIKGLKLKLKQGITTNAIDPDNTPPQSINFN
jgi:hypothetical protein